ncbi:hypothetical protein R50345_15985 [Paenibacillus sp. FSL R5-0345]|uniref:bacteriophage abortive infection AbiH family protein n=1 Tax=Paenibacillus sp. FSL R5-0345 TaxID=1536770 RepID=UPI0004F7A69E|nr:bacteriophage abortive infection AbiH family protein [Paenibacillus sp. FSL R5-0345]AIQ35986.1 hypothetical protein R50345_15985 [Paenibacillus sp. FSL R5-0345]
MKLFVIGNGFDRGHGLATNYWDFRKYLKNIDPDFLRSFEEHYYIYPRSDEKAKREMLWNELETNLANIDEEVIVEQAVNIDMGLESGDVGIEDTLHQYFSDEYEYINQLAVHLKRWVRTIRIRDVRPRTTFIDKDNDAVYVTFNYTAVLETVYRVSEHRIIHIHGSLRQRDDDPVLGHGNKMRINNIQEKRHEAEQVFNEKEISICNVVEEYYKQTYKDITKYKYKLRRLQEKDIDEIIILGHSLAGVDIPYFNTIDTFSKQNALWKVYYFSECEMQRMFDSLVDCGIDAGRIEMIHSSEFYNM